MNLNNKKYFFAFFQWKNFDWRFINQILLYTLVSIRESGVIIIFLLCSSLFYVVVSVYVLIDFFFEQVNNFFFPSLLPSIFNWKLFSNNFHFAPSGYFLWAIANCLDLLSYHTSCVYRWAMSYNFNRSKYI